MSDTERWYRTADTLPPNGMEVETRDSGGHEQNLVRDGRLWYFPDRKMYVYYVPVAWRPLQGKDASK